jgi:hypothetical protein
MQLGRNLGFIGNIILLALGAGAGAQGAAKADNPPLTIGGVVYTDVRDPVRTGLQGVTVQVRGDQGNYEAITGGVIGLWKMDVPQGTYTITCTKSGYALEHLVRGWCDGQHSITIDVNPKNLAANQSIQFLAIFWPQPSAPTTAQAPRAPAEAPQTTVEMPQTAVETPKPQRSGGGCAAAPGRRGDAGAFLAPYAAGVCALWATGSLDARRHRRR